MIRFKPVIEPAGPELRHEDGRVRPDLLDPRQLRLGVPLEVGRHQLPVNVAPVGRQCWSVRGEEETLDPSSSQYRLQKPDIFSLSLIVITSSFITDNHDS